MKVRTASMARYRAVLAETISTLPHVASTSTYVAMQAVKETHFDGDVTRTDPAPRGHAVIYGDVYPIPCRPFAALVSAAFAALRRATCADGPEFTAELDAIYGALQTAETEAEARAQSAALFRTQAPDATAQEMLDQGMGQRAAHDLLGAETMNALIAYCPAGYAEGWNQRAFARVSHDVAVRRRVDLDRARSHFAHAILVRRQGAHLRALERNAEAVLLVLREALDLNPWLAERHLLPALELQETDL